MRDDKRESRLAHVLRVGCNYVLTPFQYDFAFESRGRVIKSVGHALASHDAGMGKLRESGESPAQLVGRRNVPGCQ